MQQNIDDMEILSFIFTE